MSETYEDEFEILVAARRHVDAAVAAAQLQKLWHEGGVDDDSLRDAQARVVDSRKQLVSATLRMVHLAD